MIKHWIITGDTHGQNETRLKNIQLNMPEYDPEEEYRRQAEDSDDFGRGYRDGYGGGFYGGNRRPAYRRMNRV